MNIGGSVTEFNLAPLLFKRLRIEGSTLRARSEAYKSELTTRYVHKEGIKIIIKYIPG